VRLNLAKKIKTYNEDGTITEITTYRPEEEYKGYTNEQREFFQSKSMKKLEQSEVNKKLGGFIFALFEYEEQLNIENSDITQSDLTKLIFIATYIDYENYLKNYSKFINKTKLKELLKLDRNNFSKFYNRMKSLNIFEEVEDKIKFNTEYFIKGKITKKTLNSNDAGRLYINTIRHLYNNVNYRYHNTLGIYFKLIPFLHVESNIVCKNPEDLYCNPICLSEFAKMIKYDSKSYGKLIKNLLKVKMENGENIVVVVLFNYDGGDSLIIFNKHIFYAGENQNYESGLDTINNFQDYIMPSLS